MDKHYAEEILQQAISEAYPIWSCTGFKEDYNKAVDALKYLIERCSDD